MLKAGALDGIEGIFGLHVWPEQPTGSIGSRPGPFLAGAGRFLVHRPRERWTCSPFDC